jgi:hypothetical protein
MSYQLKHALLVGGLLLGSSSVSAVQSNFQTSPLPVSAPEFSTGKLDKKIAATYLGISESGLHLDGLGGNYIVRQANSDTIALDFSAGIFLMGGTMDTGASDGRGIVYAANVPMSVNYEYQAIQNELASLIFFVGPTINLGISSFKYNFKNAVVTGYVPPGTGTVQDTMSTTSTSLLYGVQGGLQTGIHTGSLTFTPFAMLQFLRGSSSTSFSSTNNSGSNSIDIPEFTSMSYGLDVLYHPWQMTLSGMLQEVAKSGNNNEGFKSILISLNWIY